MAIPTLSRKRKLVTRKSPSLEEDLLVAAVPDGRLDGFSEEEDSNAEESVGESDLEDEDDEISGEELDSGDELDSDEIPSEDDDEDGIRKQLRNLKTSNGSNGDLVHTNGDRRR
ncbi:hypothetical protein LTR28_011365, partial [Elasticomyces elasticus]